jgi:hypothetical protein
VCAVLTAPEPSSTLGEKFAPAPSPDAVISVNRIGVTWERLIVNRFGPAEFASSGVTVMAFPFPGSSIFPKLPFPDHIPMFVSAVTTVIPAGRLNTLLELPAVAL